MAKIDAKYKILILGDSTVGKTCFLTRYTDNTFQEEYLASIGMDYKIKSYEKEDGNSIKLYIWDTAGQDRFRSITRNYYKGADGIILIYDITNEESFNNVKHWINSIKEAIDSSEESRYVIILIGNKLDLVENGEKEREVQEEDAIKICEKNNLIWGGERSTKTIDKLELRKIFGEYMAEIFSRIGEKKVGTQVAKKISQQKKKKGKGCFGFLSAP